MGTDCSSALTLQLESQKTHNFGTRRDIWAMKGATVFWTVQETIPLLVVTVMMLWIVALFLNSR